MTARQQLGVAAAVVALIAAVTFGVTRYLGSELTPLGVGTNAPDFTASTVDFTPTRRSLHDYRGQVVLLNVWATWCAPCRAEMPSIERLYQRYGPRGLKVVAVSADEPGTDKAIRDFIREYHLTFDVLHDTTKTVERLYQLTGYPETVIIGRDGVIRKKIAGATDWSSEGNQRVVSELLSE